MTIKEVEEKTGLARSNIRFYEKEKLIQPTRNMGNGYREYSEEDVEVIKKIAYLRTLGISIETIHRLILGEISLHETLRIQMEKLDEQMVNLEQAKEICGKMLQDKTINFDNLDVEAYVPEVKAYWQSNSNIFRLDSAGFLYVWGSYLTWGVLTAAVLGIALLVWPKLPDKIPIQWSDGEVISTVSRIFIFVYPLACMVIRFLFRPLWQNNLKMYIWFHSDLVADYLANFFCFVILSVEIFSVLYIYGIVKYVETLLAIDCIVFAALLVLGMYKLMNKR